MKHKKLYTGVLALMLALVTLLGVGNIPAAGGSVPGTEAVCVRAGAPAAKESASWQDVLNEAHSTSKTVTPRKKGPTEPKPYTYADGTSTKYFRELIQPDTDAKYEVTVVKSGVENKMTGKTLYSNSYGVIDISHANEGYVTLKLTKKTSKKVLGSVDYTDAEGKVTYYDWYMEKDKTYTIPMYFGDGNYTVGILENKSGIDYYVRASVPVTVKANSELSTFLNSTFYADYANAPNTVAKAKELTQNCKTDREKINVIFNWVQDYLTYDVMLVFDKDRHQQEVVYDLDAILESRKGVCGHYAALAAGMLRSLGIPCKYVAIPEHAYISAWYETGTTTKDGVTYATGRWINLDNTGRMIKRGDTVKYFA